MRENFENKIKPTKIDDKMEKMEVKFIDDEDSVRLDNLFKATQTVLKSLETKEQILDAEGEVLKQFSDNYNEIFIANYRVFRDYELLENGSEYENQRKHHFEVKRKYKKRLDELEMVYDKIVLEIKKSFSKKYHSL